MKIAIAGLGLLGGSLALAAKKNGHTIIAYDTNGGVLQSALVDKTIDAAADDVAGLAAAEVIIIAVPVLATVEVIGELLPHLREQCVISDVGSTKQYITEQGRQLLQNHSGRFVPAHPVAGSEKSGYSAACADLFTGCVTVLCDTNDSNVDAIQTIRQLWEDVGAETITMSAVAHDRIFAKVSHLPHMLAYALVGMIGEDAERNSLMHYAAGGFRDFTRIGESDPAMWRDICLANRQLLLQAINNYQKQLSALAIAVENADAAALFEQFQASQRLRRELLTMQKNKI